MSIISIGTSNPIELDTTQLPQVSLDALIRRGASHLFGNEVASKIVGWRKGLERAYMAETRSKAGDTKLSDEQALEGYEEPSEDEESTQREKFKADALAALREGTIGQRESRTVAVDPLDVEMNKIAKAQVVVILAGQQGPDGKKLKFPKAGESVTFSNGVQRTGDEMVAKRLEKDGDNIRKAAQKVLKDKAAKAKATQASVAEVSVDDL